MDVDAHRWGIAPRAGVRTVLLRVSGLDLFLSFYTTRIVTSHAVCTSSIRLRRKSWNYTTFSQNVAALEGVCNEQLAIQLAFERGTLSCVATHHEASITAGGPILAHCDSRCYLRTVQKRDEAANCAVKYWQPMLSLGDSHRPQGFGLYTARSKPCHWNAVRGQ